MERNTLGERMLICKNLRDIPCWIIRLQIEIYTVIVCLFIGGNYNIYTHLKGKPENEKRADRDCQCLAVTRQCQGLRLMPEWQFYRINRTCVCTCHQIHVHVATEKNESTGCPHCHHQEHPYWWENRCAESAVATVTESKLISLVS